MKRLALLIGIASLAAACDPDVTEFTKPSASATAANDKIVLVGFRSTPGAAATALIQGNGGTVRQRYRYIP
ncbi:MAG TPA: hypothetical protein VGQ29_03025, partial [Gemmatimonadales bacterium]|nr:hypothetical protein [Gemmatimonadales bacterium]